MPIGGPHAIQTLVKVKKQKAGRSAARTWGQYDSCP